MPKISVFEMWRAQQLHAEWCRLFYIAKSYSHTIWYLYEIFTHDIYIYMYVSIIDVLCFLEDLYIRRCPIRGVPCPGKPQVSRCCAKSLNDVGSSLWCWPYDVGRFLCQRGVSKKLRAKNVCWFFRGFRVFFELFREPNKKLKRTVDKDYWQATSKKKMCHETSWNREDFVKLG